MSFKKLFSKLGYNKDNLLKKDSKYLPFLDYDYILFIHNLPIMMFKELDKHNQAIIDKVFKDFWNWGKIPILCIKIKDKFILFNSKKYDRVWMVLDESKCDDFSYFNFASARFWDKYESDFQSNGSVEDCLNSNIRSIRKKLAKNGLSTKTIFNLLINLLFSRFLIDKKILKRGNFEKIYNMSFEELILNKSELNTFFKFLKKRFGGDLFEEIDPSTTYSDLKLFHELFTSNKSVYKGKALFNFYDFSIIPVDVICSLYENFTKNGIYTTPGGVVDYIIANKLNTNCKVLDPSCSSGIFLAKALNHLLKKESDASVVLKNIYGIDSDELAVNMTIFAIYITLINNSDDFKLPKLKNKNIFACDFFDETLKLPKFDVIIANPPSYAAKGEKQSFEKYAKKHHVPLSNRQISEAYIPRCRQFLKNKGIVSLIVTSKIFYNVRDVKFRKYLLKNFKILEIFDLTLTRKYLFKYTKWPSAILTFTNSKTDSNLTFKSLKANPYIKLFGVIREDDAFYINQNVFLKNDWFFKTLLVGDLNDYQLILKLIKNTTLGSFVKNHPRLLMGVGFKKGGKNACIHTDEFIEKPYIRADDLKRYEFSQSGEWLEDFIESGDKRLVHPPLIMMKQSYTTDFDFIASYSSDTVIYDYNIYAIKGNWKDEKVLVNLLGVINSDLFKYFFLMTGNVGIDKNRSSLSERKNFPITENLITNDELYNQVLKRLNGEGNDFTINSEVFKSYDLAQNEIDLIDYASDVLIPLNWNDSKNLRVTTDYLKKYIENIPFDNFKSEVYLNEYVIALKITFAGRGLTFHNLSTDEFLNIINIQSGDVEDLFFKKVIKIIEDDSILIIKLNDFQFWHRACVWSDF